METRTSARNSSFIIRFERWGFSMKSTNSIPMENHRKIIGTSSLFLWFSDGCPMENPDFRTPPPNHATATAPGLPNTGPAPRASRRTLLRLLDGLRLRDLSQSQEGQPGKTMGKPWQTHGETMGKPWEHGDWRRNWWFQWMTGGIHHKGFPYWIILIWFPYNVNPGLMNHRLLPPSSNNIIIWYSLIIPNSTA